jgi:hypothetical protein
MYKLVNSPLQECFLLTKRPLSLAEAKILYSHNMNSHIIWVFWIYFSIFITYLPEFLL